MDKPTNWNKILRYLNGDISIGEELEIEEWMNERPENKEFMEFLEMIWQMEPKKKKTVDADSAWERFKSRYDIEEERAAEHKKETVPKTLPFRNTGPHRNRKSLNLFSIAGVAAAFILVTLVVWQVAGNVVMDQAEQVVEEIEYRELRTEKGQRTRVILSDGSIIHMNGDSYLRIPEYFRGNDQRRVYLEGEAYFEITSNPEVTFEIVANGTLTTVLGTKFNVRSYEEDPEVTVVVADGVVSLGYLDNRDVEPVILKGKQKGVIGNGLAPVISDVSNLSVYHGWTIGELVFEQEPLLQMINKLERWFGIEIERGNVDNRLMTKRLTASFSERQPVEDVLQSISLALDLSIEESESSNLYKLINNQP